ncbi:hypothetical protein GCM10009122_32920 [Fulvivirga kasyanovii]|jgi:hypothetical protein|uniref:Uncharacterized protein n=2 Tax=Cytophagales TaxID=768507 RepID=A0AA49JDJ2_9BACT|nr:hypothetical protein [Fulvivirga kasyanovii]MBT32375.1 hypothetical protein [Thalassovita sp.]MTI27794.1 hypothetical protein [Fulvivirga kasyanovii]WKN35981.1 hypothetical protein K4G66_26810 [Tunicatimonas sp. TK19036]
MEKKVLIKNSLIETGKNLGSGLVGMVAGSAVGRHSLWIGAATIFGGAWYQYDWLTSAGVGMVASNGFVQRNEENVSGMDGFQDEVANAKNRALSSLKALGKKVYLDKLSPSLSEKLGLNGLEDGEILMLNGDIGDIGNFDTSEVDDIIRQLEDGNADNLIGQPELQGVDSVGGLGELGNPDIAELKGADALEINAVA